MYVIERVSIDHYALFQAGVFLEAIALVAFVFALLEAIRHRN